MIIKWQEQHCGINFSFISIFLQKTDEYKQKRTQTHSVRDHPEGNVDPITKLGSEIDGTPIKTCAFGG